VATQGVDLKAGVAAAHGFDLKGQFAWQRKVLTFRPVWRQRTILTLNLKAPPRLA